MAPKTLVAFLKYLGDNMKLILGPRQTFKLIAKLKVLPVNLHKIMIFRHSQTRKLLRNPNKKEKFIQHMMHDSDLLF